MYPAGQHPKATVLAFCAARPSGCTTEIVDKLVEAVKTGMISRGCVERLYSTPCHNALRYELGEHAEVKLARLQKRWDALVFAASTSNECPIERIPIGRFNSARFYNHVSRNEPVILSGKFAQMKLGEPID